MSHDTGLNTSFQAYLDYLVSNVDNLTDPSTPAPDLANLSTNDPKVIRSFLERPKQDLRQNVQPPHSDSTVVFLVEV